MLFGYVRITKNQTPIKRKYMFLTQNVFTRWFAAESPTAFFYLKDLRFFCADWLSAPLHPSVLIDLKNEA